MARPPIHRGASETPQKLGRMTYCANPKWCEECPWDARARELRLGAELGRVSTPSRSRAIPPRLPALRDGLRWRIHPFTTPFTLEIGRVGPIFQDFRPVSQVVTFSLPIKGSKGGPFDA